MGAPSVIFTTYAENEEGANLTTNVAGTHSYVELRSDLVPQSALFSNLSRISDISDFVSFNDLLLISGGIFLVFIKIIIILI